LWHTLLPRFRKVPTAAQLFRCCAGSLVLVLASGVIVLVGDAPQPPHPPRPEELCSEEELARPEPETLGRIKSKLALTREVMDGRLPLAKAAGKFRELDRGMPESYGVQFRRYTRGRNDAERYCRQVLDFVTGELSRTAADERSRPEHDAVLGRLRAELERSLADESFKFQD
jgi:hypothetical protein